MMLKNVMDFIIDLNIHQGGMTKDQVMRYLTVTGFQSEAEAERKWDYLVLNPGMGALPYIGLQEILDLEKDVQRTKGQAFNKAEFITKLIPTQLYPFFAKKPGYSIRKHFKGREDLFLSPFLCGPGLKSG